MAGALLAINYVYVMYNRAAIMEALMAAFIVASGTARRARSGSPAGARSRRLFATLAFFTKAAAAFYVGALALAIVIGLVEAWNAGAGSVPLRVPPNGESDLS